MIHIYIAQVIFKASKLCVLFTLILDICRIGSCLKTKGMVCTFHDGCKQGIDQQIFNRKSISRKITHPQSLFKGLRMRNFA